MMDYYWLKQSDLVKAPIRIKGLDILASTASFDSYQDLTIYYFDYKNKETELTSILTSPIFLVSNEIRDLFALYLPKMRFKGIQLFCTNLEDKIAPLYFLPDLPVVDCINKKVRINPNGTIDTIILDSSRMSGDPVFRIDHITQQKVVINEDVVESLLRRNLSGIGFEKVQVIE